MKKLFTLLAIFLLFGSMTANASYYIVGTFAENGWDADNATLMVNNEITYTLSPGDNEFKVLTTLGSWNNQLNYNNIDWSRTTATCEEEAEQHNVMVVLSQTSDVHIFIVNGMICVTATPVSNANNVITYTASEKLPECEFGGGFCSGNINTAAFDVSITSHTFSYGTGTIIFNGEVTNIGEYAFSGCSSLTSITIPNSVTSIGEYAFSGCSSLTSITIPNSVTSIEYAAFSGCSGLTSIQVESDNTVYDSRNNCNAIIKTASNTLIVGCQNTVIPNSVTSIDWYTFSGCSGLTSITIPNSVTSIGYSAFSGCSSLTSITIPNSVTSIESYAFSGCSSLTSITIPNSVTSIDWYTFSGCSGLTSITIPNSVTSIGYSAFYGCSGLTSITIPNSVTSIDRCAFSGCSSLTSITIPNSVTSIGYYAFSGCSNLPVEAGIRYADTYMVEVVDRTQTTYAIKQGTKWIGSEAFQMCTGLTSITIPNSVTSIGNRAFSGCSNLTSIIIPNSVTSIEYEAFHGCSNLPVEAGIRYADTYMVEAVDKTQTTYKIKQGTKWIGTSAFSGCSSLTSITIPSSVTSIGSSAFSGCSNLTSITIPNSVTSIESYAFLGCSSLTSITIPNSVTSIGEEDTFRDCPSLYDITCLAENPPIATVWNFYSYNAILKVPCDALLSYQSDEIWGQFTDIQCVEAEETVVTTTTVVPAETEVTVAWPTSATANTYTLTITKDGVVFCTLTFNANGQLLNIAFAPGRDGAVHAPEAELTATGYQFTVTGLESGSTYAYTLDAKDAGNNVVANYTGTFTTTGGEMGVESVNKYVNTPTKVVRDGQVLIQRGDRIYDLRGQEVK